MKKIVIKKNLWSGIIAFGLGTVLLIMLPYFIKAKVNTVTSAVGPDYLPSLVLYCMIICGIGLIIKSLVFKREETIEVTFKLEGRVWLYMTALVVYVIAISYLGFLISSLIFSVISLRLMECKNRKYYLFIGVLVIFIFVSFKYGLHVSLPTIVL